MLEKQAISISTTNSVINPYVLQTDFKEICESVLNMPLNIVEYKLRPGKAITSCARSLSISEEQNYLLVISCDDDLVDTVIEKISNRFSPKEKIKNELKIINDLSDSIAEYITGFFKNKTQLDFSALSIFSQDNPAAGGILESPYGCIHVTLTRLL